MKLSGMKVDRHVHSKSSTRPSGFYKKSTARMAEMKNRSFEAAFNKSWELYQSEAPGAAKSKPVNLEQLFKFAS